MYIGQIEINNFRKYSHIVIPFNKGLNLFVGENNSGKSAIIDAIRYVIDPDYYSIRIQPDTDFNEDTKDLEITLKFVNLTATEQSIFLEYLTLEDNEDNQKIPCLYLSLSCSYSNPYRIIKAGIDKDILIDDQKVKEQLHMAYFKPLRDAENELAPRQQSRLSKILQNFSNTNNYDVSKQSVLAALHTFNETIKTQGIIKDSNSLAENNLKKLLLKSERDCTKTAIDIPETDNIEKNFKHISEKLKLDFDHSKKQGLGYYNLLFMAVELILLRKSADIGSFLLIEEPEAHLHPQLQYNLLRFLNEQIKIENYPLQIFITTHSPNISSKVPVENVILLTKDKIFSLAKEYTKASDDDYKFLSKFLDVTKANMFFAKGLIFVEGFSEEILFPVFAKILGYDLEEYGVSVISINGTSHSRYAKILQRKDGVEIPLPCSFVRDRDKLSDDTLGDKKEDIETNNMLKFYYSSEKTLEYDIAKTMWTLSCNILKGLYKDPPEDVVNIGTNTFNKSKDMFYEKMNGRGKSEFAYALSHNLLNNETLWKEITIPQYIEDAIKHVTNKICPGI